MTDRKESRDRWGESATAWEAQAAKMRRVTMPVSSWMVEALGPQPGDTILELAAGPGETGFLAAELIEPGGTLISSDAVPEMLSVAQRRAEELGLRNVRFKQIDAESSFDLEAASIDGVLCRWGFMLLNDPGTALRECRRVLKPGGRLALAAWAGPEENPWSSVPGREAVRHGVVAPMAPDEPGQFTWGADGVIAEQLAQAGFVEYEVDSVAFKDDFPSFDDYWESMSQLSGRLRQALAAADPATVEELKAAVSAAVEPFRGGDGSLSFPAKTWVAVATA